MGFIKKGIWDKSGSELFFIYGGVNEEDLFILIHILSDLDSNQNMEGRILELFLEYESKSNLFGIEIEASSFEAVLSKKYFFIIKMIRKYLATNQAHNQAHTRRKIEFSFYYLIMEAKLCLYKEVKGSISIPPPEGYKGNILGLNESHYNRWLEAQIPKVIVRRAFTPPILIKWNKFSTKVEELSKRTDVRVIILAILIANNSIFPIVLIIVLAMINIKIPKILKKVIIKLLN